MTYQSPLPSPRMLFLPFALPSVIPLVAAADAKLVGNCEGMMLLKVVQLLWRCVEWRRKLQMRVVAVLARRATECSPEDAGRSGLKRKWEYTT